MKKYTTILSALLLVQILIGAGLYWNTQQEGRGANKQTLLAFDVNQVDKIVIRGDDETATLVKKNDSWTVPDLAHLPVDKAKLNGLLGKLENLQAGWPVSTTASSHKRFEVAEEKYQRRLQLYQGDILKSELYLGSSPGFRKVHLREAGQNNVYAAKLNAFDLPAEEQSWFDKNMLAIRNVTTIETSGYRLEKQDGQWQLTKGAKEGYNLNDDSLQKLLNVITNLRVSEVVSEEEKTANNAGMQFTIVQADEVLQYRFYQVEKTYYVARNDLSSTFTLAEHDYQTIAEMSLEKLLTQDGLNQDAETTSED